MKTKITENTLKKVGSELDQRIFATSIGLGKAVDGFRSQLLDTLTFDDNLKTREEIGEPIKKELEGKLAIAKTKIPPRQTYIDSLKSIILDFENRIKYNKSLNGKNIINIDKNNFNHDILKTFTEEIITLAKKTHKIQDQTIYKKITQRSEYISDVIDLLRKKKTVITDPKQLYNLDVIIGILEYQEHITTEKEKDIEIANKKKALLSTSSQKKATALSSSITPTHVIKASTPPPSALPKTPSYTPSYYEGDTSTFKLQKPREQVATISNTTEINRAVAERTAEERLKNRWQNLSRYNPDRINIFLRRKFIKDDYTRDAMTGNNRETSRALDRNNNTTRAADRHEIEQAEGFNARIRQVLTDINTTNYPNTRTRIDDLIDRFIGNSGTVPPWQRTISEAQFQVGFNDILTHNPPYDMIGGSGRRPLPDLLRDNNIQQISTNILSKLNMFRDHQIMVFSIGNHILNNRTESLADFNAYCKPLISNYTSVHNTMPDFLNQLNIKMDDPNAMQQLQTLGANHYALSMISAQTLHMRIQLLDRGEEAYDVQRNDGILTRAGKRLDDPTENTRFGRRLDKHPGMKEAFSWIRGGTKLGTMMLPGFLLAGSGPLAVASGVGGMSLLKTFFAKRSHYSKEHKLYQRQQAVNLNNNRTERQRLESTVSGMSDIKRFLLGTFGFGQNARDVRQYRDYVRTSHDQLDTTSNLISRITGYLYSQQTLSPVEQNTLRQSISEALARLDYHRQTGQNFLGSQNTQSAEQEYQTLQRLTVSGSERLGETLTILRTNPYYTTTMGLLQGGTGDTANTQGYDRARRRYITRQNTKSTLSGIKAGGIAFGLSYLASSLFSKEAHTETTNNTIDSQGQRNPAVNKESLFVQGDVNTPVNSVLSQNGPGNIAGMDVHIKAGVDQLTYINASHSNTQLTQKLADTQSYISAHFSGNNLTTLQQALDPNAITSIKTYAAGQVADAGNQALLANRYVEGVKTFAEEMVKTGHQNTVIGSIDFNIADSIAQQSVANSAGDLSARMMGISLDYSTITQVAGNTIPIPIPVGINTFSQPQVQEGTEYNGFGGDDSEKRFIGLDDVEYLDNSKRNVATERKMLNTYINNLPPYHKDLANNVVNALPPMDPQCRVSVNIPAYHEGKGIYNALNLYTKQVAKDGKAVDPSLYEINIIVNRESNRPRDNTYEEVQRFKAENPLFTVNVIEVEFPVGQGGVGASRKLLTDATLARSLKRSSQSGVLYIESEDADLNSVDHHTVTNIIEKMDRDPQLDAVRGKQDRIPEIMMQNDLFFVCRRAWDIAEVMLRHPDYRPENFDGRDPIRDRVITGGRNTAYSAEIYARIGGYNPTMKMGEDMYIGQNISKYRGAQRGMVRNGNLIQDTNTVDTVSSRSDSSPRRFLNSYVLNAVHNKNVGPYDAFDDPVEEARVRSISDQDAINEITDFAILSPSNMYRLQSDLQTLFNFVMPRVPAIDRDRFWNRLMFMLGFKPADYTIDSSNNIHITNISNIKNALENYKKNPKYKIREQKQEKLLP